MARQLRQRAALAGQRRARDADGYVEMFEREFEAAVERAIRVQLQGLFSKLIALGPAVADRVASETDPQRAAQLVTTELLSIIESYRPA